MPHDPEKLKQLLRLPQTGPEHVRLVQPALIAPYMYELRRGARPRTIMQEVQHRLRLIVLVSGGMANAAKELGMDERTIYRWMAGELFPSPSKTVPKIDSAYLSALESVRRRMVRGSIQLDGRMRCNYAAPTSLLNMNEDRGPVTEEEIYYDEDEIDPRIYARRVEGVIPPETVSATYATEKDLP